MVETQNYIYIFEFKRDGSAEEALKQIEDMGYAREYAADGRKIYSKCKKYEKIIFVMLDNAYIRHYYGGKLFW